MKTKPMKRRIKQNPWGNWNGYVGRSKVLEFGLDEISAEHWLKTGENLGIRPQGQPGSSHGN